mmetsp:Transcript_14916/g.29999  ORF Transcript_14916/g.29999 Transcript_14916/m.29999 type:complete len:383 (-) Transcript_14916:588-1736(-)
MDSNSWIEQLQFQVNLIELFYQKRAIKVINFFYFHCKKEYYKVGWLIQRFLYWESSFLKTHIRKPGFFSPSFFKIESWFFFWLKNSSDLTGNENKVSFLEKCNLLDFLFLSEINKTPGFLLYSKSLLILYSIVLSSTFFDSKKNFQYQKKIYYFLRKLKIPQKNFRVSLIGEHDPRGLYCVLIISSIYNILTPEIVYLVERVFLLFQIYEEEGSFNKGRESQGAIAFCQLATKFFFFRRNHENVMNFQKKSWILEKQNLFDSSFRGRISKLSDSCYSFWVGASSVLIGLPVCFKIKKFFFIFKQHFSSGFTDKIGKSPDIYHTCYLLSGFSLVNFFGYSKNFFKNELTFLSFFFQQNFFFCKINPIFGLREKTYLQNVKKIS